MAEPDPDMWPSVLSTLAAGESFLRDEAAAVMRTVMEGNATPGQIGGFLMALRTKGETVDEIDGLAAELEFAAKVDAPLPVVDTCGTGGIAPEPSISRPSARSSSRPPASASRSTATGPRARTAAPPTCSRPLA